MKTITIFFASIITVLGLLTIGLIATLIPTTLLIIFKLILGFSWKYVFIPSILVAFLATVVAYNKKK